MGWSCSRHEWDEGSTNWTRVAHAVADALDRALDCGGRMCAPCPACVAELLGKCESLARACVDYGVVPPISSEWTKDLAELLSPFRKWWEDPEGEMERLCPETKPKPKPKPTVQELLAEAQAILRTEQEGDCVSMIVKDELLAKIEAVLKAEFEGEADAGQ